MPALGQVQEVEEGDKGQWDIQVAIGAGAGWVGGWRVPSPTRQSCLRPQDQPWHGGQATPGHHSTAGVDEQCEEQALPVRLAAQGASQGLFQGPLLQGRQRGRRGQDELSAVSATLLKLTEGRAMLPTLQRRKLRL